MSVSLLIDPLVSGDQSLRINDYTPEQLLVIRITSLWKKCAEGNSAEEQLISSYCTSTQSRCINILAEMSSSKDPLEKINGVAMTAIEEMNRSVAPFLRNLPSYQTTFKEVRNLLENFKCQPAYN